MNRPLAFLLILSIIGNIYMVFLYQPALQQDLQELEGRINSIEKENAELGVQVYRDNLTIQNYASMLDIYRQRVAYLESKLNIRVEYVENIDDVLRYAG